MLSILTCCGSTSLPFFSTSESITSTTKLDAGANERERLELTRLGEEGAQAVYVARTEHTHSDVVADPFYAGEVTKDLADLF